MSLAIAGTSICAIGLTFHARALAWNGNAIALASLQFSIIAGDNIRSTPACSIIRTPSTDSVDTTARWAMRVDGAFHAGRGGGRVTIRAVGWARAGGFAATLSSSFRRKTLSSNVSSTRWAKNSAWAGRVHYIGAKAGICVANKTADARVRVVAINQALCPLTGALVGAAVIETFVQKDEFVIGAFRRANAVFVCLTLGTEWGRRRRIDIAAHLSARAV